MNDIAISVRNVSKCYRTFNNQRSRLLHALWPKYKTGIQELWALKDINFEIKRGESIAIIGRNGGGKSTLLEILTGTLTPTSGEVIVNGRVSALLELGSGFSPEYTGRDNVILNGLLLGLSRQEILDRFDEIEAFAEIGDAIDRPVKTYSSGMIMRLAFAVQVLCDPDILIIDEALSVGDFFFQQKCLSYIRELRSRGTTLLFVSHDMGTIRDICTRGILLKFGKMEFCGDILEVIRQYLSSDPNSADDHVNHPSKEPCFGELHEESTSGFFLEKSLWSNLENEDTCKIANILNVCFLDEQGLSSTIVKMGTQVTIQVLFKINRIAPVHVTITFKNKYDQIITSIGSYSLKTPIPHLQIGKKALFQLNLQLDLEAGDYVFSVSLGQPDEIGHGKILDETPWLGPFQVVWDYQNDIPYFYGMVGLPATASFISSVA